MPVGEAGDDVVVEVETEAVVAIEICETDPTAGVLTAAVPTENAGDSAYETRAFPGAERKI